MTKLYDQHLHSRHSVDSKADPIANCEQAIAQGLSGLTFTEHYDMHPTERDTCQWNYEAIFNTVTDLRNRYSPTLQIGMGIEVDFQPSLLEETLIYLDKHSFDVVLLSIHWANDRPLHLRRIWNQTKATVMRDDYFKTLFKATELCQKLAAHGHCPFDILSHLDYVKRYLLQYWKTPLGTIEYHVLDPILQALIAADVFPEINTSGMRREETEPYPSWPILKRYYELGGLYVSLGSDAHQSRDIGQGFDETAKQLKIMGFVGEIVFEHGNRRVINW